MTGGGKSTDRITIETLPQRIYQRRAGEEKNQDDKKRAREKKNQRRMRKERKRKSRGLRIWKKDRTPD